LSSAGLIYKYFGREILANILGETWSELAAQYSSDDIEKMYEKIYKTFFLEIDALDNGVKQAEEKKYNIHTNLGLRVSRYNKAWNAPAEVDQNN
jgi:uncharacterized UPF0160 family protein